jgi:hypothetical protein
VVLLPTVSMMTKAAMHRMRGTMMITSRREMNSARRRHGAVPLPRPLVPRFYVKGCLDGAVARLVGTKAANAPNAHASSASGKS